MQPSHAVVTTPIHLRVRVSEFGNRLHLPMFSEVFGDEQAHD
jgi:hypothetical protein